MFRILRHSVLEESLRLINSFSAFLRSKKKKAGLRRNLGSEGEKGEESGEKPPFLHTLTWNWSWILQVILFFWFSDLCAGVLGGGEEGWGWELAVKGKKNKQNLFLDLPAMGSTLILTASVSGVDWFLTAGDELTPGIPTFGHLWPPVIVRHGLRDRTPDAQAYVVSSAAPSSGPICASSCAPQGGAGRGSGSPAKGTRVLSEQKAEACAICLHSTPRPSWERKPWDCAKAQLQAKSFSLPNTFWLVFWVNLKRLYKAQQSQRSHQNQNTSPWDTEGLALSFVSLTPLRTRL